MTKYPENSRSNQDPRSTSLNLSDMRLDVGRVEQRGPAEATLDLVAVASTPIAGEASRDSSATGVT